MAQTTAKDNFWKHPIFERYSDAELADKMPYGLDTIEGMRRGWRLVTKRFKLSATKAFPGEKLFR